MGLKPALFWFVLVALLTLTWKLLHLPTEAEMIGIVKQWLLAYGLLVVFAGSFLEALLFIGFYFPGSIIIFLGVALSPSPLRAIEAVAAVSCGMLCGYTINYLLGRYGWYRLFLKLGMRKGIDQATVKIKQNELRTVFYTFWNPGLGSFTSTAAGIVQLPFRRFLALMIGGIFVWNTFWGITVYSLGETSLMLLDFTLVLKVIVVWIVFEVGMLAWRRFLKA